MRRDPLAVLGRLRALAVRDAQRDLAERRGAEAEGETRLASTHAALQAEARTADHAAYAAWLPRGRAERAVAATQLDQQQRAAAAALAALAAARSEERVIEQLVLDRAMAARREARQREQAWLDEAGARR